MSENYTHDHDNECGSQDEVLKITLEFDDGEDVVCEPLFIFDFDGKEYIALVPYDEESDDVYIYAYNELGDDEFEFLDIDSDEEFDKVVAEFERIIEEAENASENE